MWRKLRGDHCTGRCWDHILFFLATAIHQLGARVLSCFSCVRFFATLWTVAHPAPLSMGFSREEYWSGLPCPPPGDLPDPGIKPASVSCIGRWILYHQHHLGSLESCSVILLLFLSNYLCFSWSYYLCSFLFYCFFCSVYISNNNQTSWVACFLKYFPPFILWHSEWSEFA